jgi:hypothetical protein
MKVFLINQTVVDDKLFKNAIGKLCNIDLSATQRKPASDIEMFNRMFAGLSLDLFYFTFLVPCSVSRENEVINAFPRCHKFETEDYDVSLLLLTFNLCEIIQVMLSSSAEHIAVVLNALQTALSNIGYAEVFNSFKMKTMGDGSWLLLPH